MGELARALPGLRVRTRRRERDCSSALTPWREQLVNFSIPNYLPTLQCSPAGGLSFRA